MAVTICSHNLLGSAAENKFSVKALIVCPVRKGMKRTILAGLLRGMKPKGMHEASLVAAEDRPEVYQFDDAVPLGG
jgi:hypothetical protein